MAMFNSYVSLPEGTVHTVYSVYTWVWFKTCVRGHRCLGSSRHSPNFIQFWGIQFCLLHTYDKICLHVVFLLGIAKQRQIWSLMTHIPDRQKVPVVSPFWVSPLLTNLWSVAVWAMWLPALIVTPCSRSATGNRPFAKCQSSVISNIPLIFSIHSHTFLHHIIPPKLSSLSLPSFCGA